MEERTSAVNPAFHNASDPLGLLLLDRRCLSFDQYTEATTYAKRWNTGLLEVILARRWVAGDVLFENIAQHYGLPLINLKETPPDAALLLKYDPQELLKRQLLPFRTEGDTLIVATSRPGPATLLEIMKIFGSNIKVVVAQPFQITMAFEAVFRNEFSDRAIYALAELDPEMSAQRVITAPQVTVIYLFISAMLAGFAFAPIATLIAINGALTLFYVGNFLFKVLLVWVGGDGRDTNALSIATEAQLLREDDLPVYTVLVPMFHEPEVLPILAGALRNLDYPLGKLDIKIVLEEDDNETIDAAFALGLEGVFEILRVPQSHPQTKPKACNYALNFARGEFLVIYDAEDKPEPDQLRKAIAAFRQMPENTGCVQCRLSYYNAQENWLTRMFTLDYALWFDLMLPGLDRLRVPIPLGGTSNHFRMEVLRELNAWDPFNVTEDADLGIRLTQKGYRVGVIDSTTYEEANVSIPNWIRQRSRWVKGYMQTFLVHTRRPRHLLRTVGPVGVAGFIAFIGGTFLSGLLNPLFWGVFVIWLVMGADAVVLVFPPVILYMSLINLLAGNGLLIYLTMIAPFRRGWSDLAPWAITVVGYWVLMTIASYKGLYQLIVNPFYWEKTQHGLSKQTPDEVNAAVAVNLEQDAR